MTRTDEPASMHRGPASSADKAPLVGRADAAARPLNLDRLVFWLSVMAICAASGALYGAIDTRGRVGFGVIYGLGAGGGVLLFEQGVAAPRLRLWLRQLPMVPSVLLTEVVYIVMILAGTAAAGSLLWVLGFQQRSWWASVAIEPITLVYALIVSGTVITLNRFRELIGGEVFRNLLFGRYYHPVEEERIFLFLDLIGSTAYAQRHGDLKAQAFLGAIFSALAEPVRRHRGAIDDYVGDMAMVTWPMDKGLAQARCVACIFDFLEAVARDAQRWHREFGQVPQFRAALHGGSVVTAEVGLDRRKIAYFGDVVNTTGRLEGLCKTLDTPVLVSSDLLDRLAALPPGIAPRALGCHAVKGRGQQLSVFALDHALRTDEPRRARLDLSAREPQRDVTSA